MKKFLLTYIFSLIAVLGYSTQYEYNTSTPSIRTYDGSPMKVGQTFLVGSTSTNESFVIDSVSIYISMAINYNVYVEIYTLSGGLPTGSPISTGTIPLSRIPSSSSWVNCEVTSAALSASTSYALVFYSTEEYYDPPTYDLFNVGVTLSNNYTGGNMVSYSGGTWASDVVNQDLVFRIYGKHAPIITSQPTSITRCVGTSATFSVVVDSDSPTYQWRKGGSNISGATSSSYTIASVVSGSAGNYDCVVTESLLGTTTTSSTATLTVPTTTSITSHPSSISRCVGTSATFSVTASGTSLTYQWKKDGSNISGATSTSYTISSVATGDAGNYTVTVTGTCGTVTSNTATLTVNTLPSISVHPVSQTKELGESVTFSVTASGSGLTYQWRKNSSNISGATSSSYTIPTIVASDAASYDVYISGTCASVTSNSATLTISDACLPEAYWRFENNGNDDMGNHQLTAYNSAGYSTAYAVEGSYAADLNIYSSNKFQSDDIDWTTGGGTISFNFRTTKTYGQGVIVTNQATSGSSKGFRLLFDTQYNRLILHMSNGVYEDGAYTTPNSIIVNTQHHIVVRWLDVNGSNVAIYIDGVLKTTYDSIGFPGSGLNSSFAIGCSKEANDYSIRGTIDNFLVYKKALSTTEITELYTNRTNDHILTCEEVPPAVQSRKKILLASKLRNIILSSIDRDFGYRIGSDNPIYYEGNPYADGVNVLYVDIAAPDGLGSESNDGSSPETPVTISQVASLYASYDTIAFSDTIHRSSLTLASWSGTIGTYHRYGNQRATLSGYKILGSLTNLSGNIYTVADADLPSVDYYGTEIREITGAGAAYHALPTYNYLLRDGVPYAAGRYPASGFLNTTNTDVADPPTYFDDTETTFASGYWTGAYINWSNNGVRKWDMQRAVTSYNGSRYTFTTTMDLSGIIESERDNTNYFLSNHPNACTSNGDWYYYPGTHTFGVYESGGTTGHIYEFGRYEFVLFLDECSDVVVENIEFQGGLEATVMVDQGSGIYFDSCAIKYGGIHGIDAYSVDNIAFNDGVIDYTTGTGIYFDGCNGEQVLRNEITNIAIDYSMTSNVNMGNAAIISNGRYGTSDISYNTIDGVAYNAIQFYGRAASGIATSQGNAITQFTQRLSDGGAYYINGVNESKPGNLQIIRNNYIADAMSDDYICPVQDAWGVYQDGYGEGTWADSNVIIGTSNAFFVHNVRRMSVKNNICYNNFHENVNYARAGILHTQQAWTSGYGIQIIKKNITIARDSLETGYLFVWDGSLDYAYNDVDSNYHYNPFLENENASVATTYPLNYRNLSYFTSSPFNWMEESTFNTPDWTYQDVSGITRDQFVRIYYNHSATAHTFDLGGLTLKPIPSGPNVSESITLQPYKSAAYFYVSGSFTGADNTYYE